MTLFQLQCFVSVANTLNFTRSANELYITQPALSKSISSLEQELNLAAAHPIQTFCLSDGSW